MTSNLLEQRHDATRLPGTLTDLLLRGVAVRLAAQLAKRAREDLVDVGRGQSGHPRDVLGLEVGAITQRQDLLLALIEVGEPPSQLVAIEAAGEVIPRLGERIKQRGVLVE